MPSICNENDIQDVTLFADTSSIKQHNMTKEEIHKPQFCRQRY